MPESTEFLSRMTPLLTEVRKNIGVRRGQKPQVSRMDKRVEGGAVVEIDSIRAVFTHVAENMIG
jgi:hypothetical protein